MRTSYDHSQQPYPSHKMYQLLRSLENQHRELEQTLKEKNQSLNLQINFQKSSEDTGMNRDLTGLVEELFKYQTDIRTAFSQSLLERQIQMQQEKQKIEIVSNYEKYIYDLRAKLINKEGEITFSCTDRARETTTTKQNIHLFNKDHAEKAAILREIKQHKKLTVEIEALEYTLKKTGINNRSEVKSQTESVEIVVKNLPTALKMQKTKQIPQEGKPPELNACNTQREMLVWRVFNLLEGEMQREKLQRDELQKLRQQFENLNRTQRGLNKRYQKLEQQRIKMQNIRYHSPKRENRIQTKLSFIEQLEKEIELEESSSQNCQLFTKRDLNQAELVTSFSKPAPTRFQKQINYRQRRHRTAKQN